MMTENDATQKYETAKLGYDIYKHLITLNTGSIVILITLLEKLFANPEWRLAIAISLCSFTISLLACLSMLIVITSYVGSDYKFITNRNWELVGNYSTVAAWGGFLLGIVSLVVFAIKNLY